MKATAHPDLELSGTTLLDAALGTRYILTPDAAWLFKQFKKEPNIEQLIKIVMQAKGLKRADAAQAVYALLGLLDVFGGVRVYGLTTVLWLQTRTLWRQRYICTTGGFIRGMIRAYGMGFILVSLPLGFSELVVGLAVPIWWLLLPAALLFSCVVHEAGHAIAANRCAIPFVFLSRPGFAAILYRRPGWKQARLIALSGPCAATVFCLVLAFAANGAASYLFLLGALIQAGSLLPFLADGRTIWRSI